MQEPQIMLGNESMILNLLWTNLKQLRQIYKCWTLYNSYRNDKYIYLENHFQIA